ncbi:MAG: hypothetical protein SFU98_15395 [Leptospiraceae bacterium]|nr:hypothetical protein [Leptospiraceae bacterium]
MRVLLLLILLQCVSYRSEIKTNEPMKKRASLGSISESPRAYEYSNSSSSDPCPSCSMFRLRHDNFPNPMPSLSGNSHLGALQSFEYRDARMRNQAFWISQSRSSQQNALRDYHRSSLNSGNAYVPNFR